MSADVSPRRERRLVVALVLNLGIVAAQVVFGVAANSLGLLADAGHNLADVAALVISLLAVRLARRPPTAARSFGMHRSTILAAQANAASILALTALIVFEAVRRFSHPGHVEGGIVVIVAVIAGVGNLGSALVLGGRDHAGDGHRHEGTHDLNMRSALLHMLGDAAASAGVVIAGAVILVTGGWDWLDPAASVGVSALIAWQAWGLLRDTAEVLLEATPAGLDVDAMADAITAIDGVDAVHDLHVWTLSSDVRAMSAHLVVDGHPTLEEAQAVGDRVKAHIGPAFRIAHVTFELECEQCAAPEDCCAIDTPAVGAQGRGHDQRGHR